MNNKELHALVYETKKGEICMIVVDNVGNVKFAAPVAPESVISMLATLPDCGKWEMPPYILDARKWWNAMASTPGTELVYCRRPLWENMREAGRRAFYKLSPSAHYPQSFVGKDILILVGSLKNKAARTRITEAVRTHFGAVELGTSPSMTFKLKSLDDFSRLITTIREAKNDDREYCRVVVVGCDVVSVR